MNKRMKIGLLAVLCGAVAIAATVVGYQDWQVRTTPLTPGTGYWRTWADSASGFVKCIKADGSNCFFAAPPLASAVVLQTNGTNNGSQSLLNLHAGTNMTLTDNGSGQITFASAGGGGSLLLQTNTVNNGSQALLNLLSGGGITLVDNGSGGVTISTTAGSTRGIGMAFGMTGGTALSAGATQYVTVPFACTIVGWNMTVDAGTATADVWKLAAGPSDWAGTSGTVNTGGTGVTWLTGSTFPADAAGRSIVINSVTYTVASVTSPTVLVLTTSAGSQSGVAFAGPGSSIPTVTNSIVAAAYPAVASGTFAGSTAVSTWTKAVTKNDVFGFNVKTVAGGTAALSVVLECQQ